MTPEQGMRERDHLNGLPVTESRSERTRALLRRAEDAGHTALALGLRLDLLRVENMLCGRTAPEHRGPRTDRMRLDFTRVLTLHDHHPEYFGESEEIGLWDTVPFLIGDLLNRSAAKVTDLTALLDELEHRFSPTGDNFTILLHIRSNIARHIGDYDREDDLVDRIRPRKWMPTWRLQDFVSQRVCTLTLRDQHHEAIETARPLLDGEVTSTDPDGSPSDPRHLVLNLLESYLHTGQLDQAREAYHRTSGLVRVEGRRRENMHWSSIEGLHVFYLVARLNFLSVSGNEPLALDLLRHTAPLVVGTVYDHSQLSLAAAVALACRRLTETGRGHETIEVVDGGTRRRMSAADLYRDRTEHAMVFARRADRCNGNDLTSRLYHDETIHADPIVDHLDLGTEAGEDARG